MGPRIRTTDDWVRTTRTSGGPDPTTLTTWTNRTLGIALTECYDCVSVKGSDRTDYFTKRFHQLEDRYQRAQRTPAAIRRAIEADEIADLERAAGWDPCP